MISLPIPSDGNNDDLCSIISLILEDKPFIIIENLSLSHSPVPGRPGIYHDEGSSSRSRQIHVKTPKVLRWLKHALIEVSSLSHGYWKGFSVVSRPG